MSGAAPDPLDRIEAWGKWALNSRHNAGLPGCDVLALVEVARAARDLVDVARTWPDPLPYTLDEVAAALARLEGAS